MESVKGSKHISPHWGCLFPINNANKWYFTFHWITQWNKTFSTRKQTGHCDFPVLDLYLFSLFLAVCYHFPSTNLLWKYKCATESAIHDTQDWLVSRWLTGERENVVPPKRSRLRVVLSGHHVVHLSISVTRQFLLRRTSCHERSRIVTLSCCTTFYKRSLNKLGCSPGIFCMYMLINTHHDRNVGNFSSLDFHVKMSNNP